MQDNAWQCGAMSFDNGQRVATVMQAVIVSLVPDKVLPKINWDNIAAQAKELQQEEAGRVGLGGSDFAALQ